MDRIETHKDADDPLSGITMLVREVSAPGCAYWLIRGKVRTCPVKQPVYSVSPRGPPP